MSLQRLLGGDPRRQSLLYLAIGGLSLAKAIAVRHDRDRFRRELRDAIIFLGVGIALGQYATVRDRKREELREAVPGWIRRELPSETTRVRSVLGSERSRGTDDSYRERARQLLRS